ncbi:MAG: hypothetical protein AAFN50_03815, partial [Pseudomonadota bacterium]
MKNIIGKAILITATCAIGAAAAADTLYFDKEEQVRAIAKQYSEYVRRDLPLQISENAIWESSRARGKEIHNTVVLSSTDSLRGVLSNSTEANSARTYWQRITRATVCDSPVARAFVGKGGVVHTVYEFESQAQLSTLTSTTCSPFSN